MTDKMKDVKSTTIEYEQLAKSLKASNILESSGRATAHKKISNAFSNLNRKKLTEAGAFFLHLSLFTLSW
jgi:hypothetical protein